MLDDDDQLTVDALYEVVRALNPEQTIDVIYTDLDYISPEGKPAGHLFKPDWSPALFRGLMYVGHLLTVRRTIALDSGGFGSSFDSVQDYEFMLRMSERTRHIRHLLMALYHRRRIPESVAAGGEANGNIEGLHAAAVQAHLERLLLDGCARPNPRHPHRVFIEAGRQQRRRKTAFDLLVHGWSVPTTGATALKSALARTAHRAVHIVVPPTLSEVYTIDADSANVVVDRDSRNSDADRLSRFWIASSSVSKRTVLADVSPQMKVAKTTQNSVSPATSTAAISAVSGVRQRRSNAESHGKSSFPLERGKLCPESSEPMTRNLIFVSHCNFDGNSAMHLFSIANELTTLGHSCVVCVPGRPETVLDHGEPRFQVLDYAEAVLHGVSFTNGRAPDLVHAWTPRELVRKTTMSLARRYNIPCFVHLEDNEIVVLLDELPGWSLEDLERLPTCSLDLMVPLHRIHPHHWRRLLAGAAGVTVLIDRLLEFKPSDVPGLVFFPGHDAAFAKIGDRDEELRAALGIAPEELLVVYTGTVHRSNFEEIRSLVIAIALVNRRGIRVKLAKTGRSEYVLPEFSDPEIAQHLIERGFVARSEIARLLAAADLLVQPGQANLFNDYRFPSKLPEFLASGRPVILPRSNVGLLLKDGEEALVLERGDSTDIANALQRLAADPELRTRIGRCGREFALRNLDWTKNVAVIPSFYDQCLDETRSTASLAVASDSIVPETRKSVYEERTKESAGYQALLESRGWTSEMLSHAARMREVDLREELQRQVTLASRLEGRLKRSAERISGLEAEIEHLKITRFEAKRRYHSITTSLSWRLTWPLRVIRDAGIAIFHKSQSEVRRLSRRRL
jgi:glycosyltransferase involved in cell wall biosynthesis